MNTYEIRNKIKQGRDVTWAEAFYMVEELEKIEKALAEMERKWRIGKVRQCYSDIIG